MDLLVGPSTHLTESKSTQILLTILLVQICFLMNNRDSTPVSVIRRREMKWLQMLDEWDKYMSTKYKKVLQIII